MITFDASKFMETLDNYVQLRAKPLDSTSFKDHEWKEEAYNALLEQLKTLEDAVKMADRLLLAQVEIAGLVKSANKFMARKETMPVAALGCVVRALSALSDLGEEAEPSIEEGPPEPVPCLVSVEGWRERNGIHRLFRGGVVVATAEWGRYGRWAHWYNSDGRQMDVTDTLDNAKRAAEMAVDAATTGPSAQVTTTQETSMPKIFRQKDVLALKRLLQCVRFEKASFNQIFSDPADPLPKTEAEVTEFIKRRTRLYIETWVAPIVQALIARGDGLDDPNGEQVLDNASRGN